MGQIELPVEALVQPGTEENTDGRAGRRDSGAGAVTRSHIGSRRERQVKNGREADRMGQPCHTHARSAGDPVEGRL